MGKLINKFSYIEITQTLGLTFILYFSTFNGKYHLLIEISTVSIKGELYIQLRLEKQGQSIIKDYLF